SMPGYLATCPNVCRLSADRDARHARMTRGRQMASTTAAPRRGARVHVQKFGTFLSNMVLPNIGAFIAWGLITALFIEAGWLPGIFHGLKNPDGWVAQIG